MLFLRIPTCAARVITWLAAVSCGDTFADITQLTPLSFGTVAVSDNTAAQTINVTTSGRAYYSNYVHPIQDAQRGVYLLSNFPTNQILSVTTQAISSTTTSSQASSEQFSLTNVNTTTYVTTDASGEATIYVGGTLSTSGSGSSAFSNTQYTAQFQITVNY